MLAMYRCEIHEGKLEGSRQSDYNHPDVDIYQLGTLSASGVSQAAINYAIVNWLSDHGLRAHSLFDNRGKARKVTPEVARQQLVLSLFPGADLLGRAFEAKGFTVVRGPDKLWGGDVRNFHVPAGRFDGVIGGPPCQIFSVAKVNNGTDAVDLIPEFLRIVEEAQPKWAVMENVTPVLNAPSCPTWPNVTIRDWDCLGLTHRKRTFWFYGIESTPAPATRAGEPEYSVLATSWKLRKEIGGTLTMQSKLPPNEAARLQGFPGLDEYMMESRPTMCPKGWWGNFIVHMMGNGVPFAMGSYIADHVLDQLLEVDSYRRTGLPLFEQPETDSL